MQTDKISVQNLNLYYGAVQALKQVNITIPEKSITAFIGPSGCGKSTFLKTLNRLNDLIANVKITGQVLINGVNIYNSNIDLSNLRKKVGMVFQQANPFPTNRHRHLIRFRPPK